MKEVELNMMFENSTSLMNPSLMKEFILANYIKNNKKLEI